MWCYDKTLQMLEEYNYVTHSHYPKNVKPIIKHFEAL